MDAAVRDRMQSCNVHIKIKDDGCLHARMPRADTGEEAEAAAAAAAGRGENGGDGRDDGVMVTVTVTGVGGEAPVQEALGVEVEAIGEHLATVQAKAPGPTGSLSLSLSAPLCPALPALLPSWLPGWLLSAGCLVRTYSSLPAVWFKDNICFRALRDFRRQEMAPRPAALNF